MTTYLDVNPASFIVPQAHLPATGRGAWNRRGIDFSWRYEVNPDGAARIGSVAGKSLDHWAVAAGSHAIQKLLIAHGFLAPLAITEYGYFGPKTVAAVQVFQRAHGLEQDGTVGTTDAKALITPEIDLAETKYAIPKHWLRGEAMHESSLDPGALGSQIYRSSTGAFAGVDRGAFQINSLANNTVSWPNAFDIRYAAGWSASRLRSYHDLYRDTFPGKTDAVYWQAAVVAHNNPTAARGYLSTGVLSVDAQTYLDAVEAAIY